MRKFALAATAVAALSVGLQTPAFAAAPDAPTDLTVSWVKGQVHLSWKDNGESNQILVEYNGGTPELIVGVTGAGGNEVPLVNPLVASDKVRLIVKSSDNGGLSEGTATPYFDTRRPVVPALKDANLAANLSTALTWTQGAAAADQTPGDPLDIDGPGSVQANVDLPGTATKTQVFAPGATSGTVPAVARPAAIKLSAVNEWGESAQDVKVVRLGTLNAGITVPATGFYGDHLGIKSTLDLFTSEGREEKAKDVKVELQARGKTTDAWRTYGRFTGNTTAAFDTKLAVQGNRQYRLWVPARKVVSGNVIALTPASSTSAKSSKAYIKFVSGGFSPSSARIGQRVTLSSKINPGVTVTGTVSVWAGGSWVTAGDIPYTKGSYVERGGPETERISFKIRFTVPAIVINGLTVNATTSPSYSLTVR
ncbi:hypothetical protein OG474_21290 [Kribbella sp. NBC_01505]|uniref:hypothetical protein n=1 Tax=Kribbella sp. NBC_01505 TaxID=2903580 RepID=UPI003870487D